MLTDRTKTVIQGLLLCSAGLSAACSSAEDGNSSTVNPGTAGSTTATAVTNPSSMTSQVATSSNPMTMMSTIPGMSTAVPNPTTGTSVTIPSSTPTQPNMMTTVPTTVGMMTTVVPNPSGMTSTTPEPTDDVPSMPPTSPATSGDVPVPTTGGATPDICTFTQAGSIAPKISTVGVVTWSSTLAGMTEAQIDFGLAGGEKTMSAPVDMSAPEMRTLLLGMKGDNDYSYRIVAKAGGTTCVSEDYPITTGSVPTSVPFLDISVSAGQESKIQPGFIIMSGGLGGLGGPGGGGGGGSTPAYIIDQDGDPVWWSTEAPGSTSRAKMNWEGTQMWMMELNVENAGSTVKYVTMDGEGATTVPELTSGHHDFTVLPGGIIGATLWNSSGMDPHNSLQERSPNGTMKTIVPDLTALYTNGSYHPNAIHYDEWDDSYTISDRNPNLFVKVKRDGTPVWQIGGTSNPPSGKKISLPAGVQQWQVNHGHQLLPDGTFLFFNNGAGGGKSTVFAFLIDEAAGTSTSLWSYQSNTSSTVLGDIQSLPNGNFLVTYSTSGVMHEIDSTQKLVRSVSGSTMGYAEFRPSLYGKPYRP